MQLKIIESIIDSIDPYQFSKDLGYNPIKILLNKESNSYLYYSDINNQKIRILNTAFVNLNLQNNLNSKSFIAGSGIDLLAYYYDWNYDKALTMFFNLYGNALKGKLIHSPKFIKNIILNTFIKRKNLLHYLIPLLFKEDLVRYHTSIAWLSKKNIDISNIKGYLTILDAENLHKFLAFIFDNSFIDFYQVEEHDSYKQFDYKSIFSENIYSSKEWIVIPYFSNYYNLAAIKLINPFTSEEYIIYIDKSKILYAGLYTLPLDIDITNKIRFLEDNLLAATLIANTKKLLNTSLCYLPIKINPDGIYNAPIYFSQPIYLYTKNSNLQYIKCINEIYPNLLICDFNNYCESNILLNWNNFISREFKALVTSEKILTPKIKAFLSIIDFSNSSIKPMLTSWLKENNYLDICTKLNEISNCTTNFRNFSILTTNNGYIAKDKNNTNDIIITNFIIKIDNTILFKDQEDMLLIGRIIMGDDEYPVKFFRKDLYKKDALETISLKAFSSFNLADNLLSNSNIDPNYKTLPIVLDKSYKNSLVTVINTEISKANVFQGNLKLGWDKTNNSFTTPCWKANSLDFKIQKQYFYYTSELDYIFETTLIRTKEYKDHINFLNKDIKNIISVILAFIFRTYYGLNIKPCYVLDTKDARNLIKFIFAALGQLRPYNLEINKRLLKSNKLLENANKFPIYARSENIEYAIQKDNYPFILFLKSDEAKLYKKDLYIINTQLAKEDYNKLTKFTLDTLNRFFKWLFNLSIEEFDSMEIVTTQNDIINEGNRIFSYLWWSEILKECNKDEDPNNAFALYLSKLDEETFYKIFVYAPSENKYILKRYSIRNNTLLEDTVNLYKILKKYSLSSKLNLVNFYYDTIDKNFFEKHISNVYLKGNVLVDKTKIKTFLPPNIQNSINKRTLSVGN